MEGGGGRGDAPERDDEKIRLVTGLRPYTSGFLSLLSEFEGKPEFLLKL